MDIRSGKWSVGAIMLVIVPIALQIVLLEGAWAIVLIPPVTIGLLTINLGLFFVLVRPRSWQPRIIGMMIGGVAASLASALFLAWEFRSGPPGAIGWYVRSWLEGWSVALADPGGGTASLLRTIGHNTLVIEAGMADLLGAAMIWVSGSLDQEYRRQAERRRGEPVSVILR
jgi:hypothetical protein